MLEAEVQSQILALYFNEKKSIRQIAKVVGVDRKTVRRIVDRRKINLERSLLKELLLMIIKIK